MAQALYYPWIDIRDEAWLKTAVLYWDSVRTIVPESIDQPYSTDSARALCNAGFLVPLRVHSGMEEIEDLTGDVLHYLGSNEGSELLVAGRMRPGGMIHLEKLPHELRRLAEIHPEKLPYEIRHMVSGLGSHSLERPGWLEVDETFGLFYMTLLANRLSERVGARLLTPLPTAERLAFAARFDANLNGIVPLGRRGPWRPSQEYEAFGPRRLMSGALAPGMLAQLTIEKIGVAPDTPIERLLAFREQHSDELAAFRTKIEQLTASVETDLSAQALRQRLSDIHKDEVEPATRNLKKALKGRKIRSLSEGIMKITFMSAGSSTLLVAAGLAVPTALLAGAGLSLVVSGMMYNVDKRESLRNNPYSYLLSAETELA